MSDIEEGSQLKRKLLGSPEVGNSPSLPKRSCPTSVILDSSVMADVKCTNKHNMLNPDLMSISNDLTQPHEIDNIDQNLFAKIELSPSKFGKGRKSLNEENFRKEIDKIKNRRSSVSRGVLSRISNEFSNKMLLSQQVKEKDLDTINSTYALGQSNFGDKEIAESSQYPILNGSSEPISARTVSFNNKTNVLRQEFLKWKELKSNRAARMSKAEREFKEAKNGDTVIEEDEVMPYLSEDMKSFLFSKPNYEQYLQEVRMASEQLDLTHVEVQKVLVMHQKVLHVSKLVSEAAFVTLENDTFGNLQKENLKDMLKNMME